MVTKQEHNESSGSSRGEQEKEGSYGKVWEGVSQSVRVCV